MAEQLRFSFAGFLPGEVIRRSPRRASPRPKQRIVLRQLPLRFPRKCSPLPRARSLNPRKVTMREREQLEPSLLEQDADLREAYANRPKTRADCKDMPRPCPWVSCRHHAAIEVHEETLSLKLNFPHISAEDDEFDLDLEQLHDTCTLDVADRAMENGEELGWEEVGAVSNLSVERCRQLAATGLQDMLVKLRRITGGQIVPITAVRAALLAMRGGNKR